MNLREVAAATGSVEYVSPQCVTCSAMLNHAYNLWVPLVRRCTTHQGYVHLKLELVKITCNKNSQVISGVKNYFNTGIKHLFKSATFFCVKLVNDTMVNQLVKDGSMPGPGEHGRRNEFVKRCAAALRVTPARKPI